MYAHTVIIAFCCLFSQIENVAVGAIKIATWHLLNIQDIFKISPKLWPWGNIIAALNESSGKPSLFFINSNIQKVYVTGIIHYTMIW
jgi:hypothetical protein